MINTPPSAPDDPIISTTLTHKTSKAHTAHTSLFGSFIFNFMQFSAKKNCQNNIFAPPALEFASPRWEILDLSQQSSIAFSFNLKKKFKNITCMTQIKSIDL